VTSQDFLVKGWSVEGRLIKVVEQIVMDFGLMIHKTKVAINSLITIEFDYVSYSLRWENMQAP